jgi:hypothetical protein
MQENPNQNYVITDVRFQNELDFVHDMKGTTIEIERGIPPHWYSIAVQSNRGDTKALEFMRNTGVHESEWNWIGGDIDHKVINSGTVEDLKQNLLKCLRITYGSNIMSELK